MSAENEDLSFTGVWIVGHDAFPVAIFRYVEQAEDWAREHYFGNWLTRQIDLAVPPLFTTAEWEKAKERTADLVSKFKEGRQA